MKEFTFRYEGRLTSLNEYIKQNRGSKGKFFGSKIKKFWTEAIADHLGTVDFPAMEKPVFVTFHWIVPDAKTDPDNIIFGKKFVLDGMKVAGLIPGDSQKYIAGFQDTWQVDRDSKGAVLVTVKEVQGV